MYSVMLYNAIYIYICTHIEKKIGSIKSNLICIHLKTVCMSVCMYVEYMCIYI